LGRSVLSARDAAQKEHPLEYLAQCFDLVDDQYFFYGHIKPELAKVWGAQGVRSESRFCVHCQTASVVTHSPSAVMEPTSAPLSSPAMKTKCWRAKGWKRCLEGKLAALLIQFPRFLQNTS